MEDMTAGRLRELLEEFDPDTPVRMAQQPPWPFEYSVADLRSVEPEEAEVDAFPGDADAVTVYLVEGEQLRYLPEHAAQAIGWSR